MRRMVSRLHVSDHWRKPRQSRYQVQLLKHGSDNGIDYIAFKRKNGKIVDVIVVESKSAGTGCCINFGTTLNYGDQMGTEWINYNLQQIANGQGNVSEEIKLLCKKLKSSGSYKRAVTSIDEATETLNLTFLEIFD